MDERRCTSWIRVEVGVGQPEPVVSARAINATIVGRNRFPCRCKEVGQRLRWK